MTSHWKLMLMMALALAAVGCHRGANDPAHNVQTQTIAPAPAQPAPNGSDAMTQTVDVEDSRSEAEGGTATMAPATNTAPNKAPTPARKKK